MKEVRLGVSGLGRLGSIHARNLCFNIPHCKLIAVCDADSKRLDWAQEELGVEHVYTDYEEMCRRDDLDGIFLVSPTALHERHIATALENGKHVFCEKPLAITVAGCEQVEKERAKYPDLICMIGFMRRYDPSYMRLKQKIDQGIIGKPFFVRSSSGDMNKTAKFQAEFAPKNGGIFVDMAVHDIDIIHFLSGQKMERVFSVGGAYCHPGFAEFKDADNAAVLAEQKDGTIAMIKLTRNDFYGDSTDVMVQGTKGMLHAHNRSRKDLLDEYLKGGIKIECTQSFTDRFKEAFVNEANAFIGHILKKTSPESTLADAAYATKAAIACRIALQSKTIVEVKNVTD